MMTQSLEKSVADILPKPAVAELVERYGDVYGALFYAEDDEWKNIVGMGKKNMERLHAIKSIIYAVHEGRRNMLEDATSPEQVFRAMGDMQYLEVEEVRALYLNCKNKIIKWATIAKGNIISAPMDIRSIFATAIRLQASAIVLVHNHPSGDSSPSPDDIRCTKKVKEAGHIIQIPILDHIIIGAGCYTSLAEQELI